MHEGHLVQAAVAEILGRAAAHPGRQLARVILGLSPDAQLDEIGLRLHLEPLLAGTVAAAAAVEVRAEPARLFCPRCAAEFARAKGVFHCPACGAPARPAAAAGGLRVIAVEPG